MPIHPTLGHPCCEAPKIHNFRCVIHLAEDQGTMTLLLTEFNRRKYNEDTIFPNSLNTSPKIFISYQRERVDMHGRYYLNQVIKVNVASS